MLDFTWETGVDQGIRFLNTQPGPFACMDATSHVCALYRFAERCVKALGENVSGIPAKAAALQRFFQAELFSQ